MRCQTVLINRSVKVNGKYLYDKPSTYYKPFKLQNLTGRTADPPWTRYLPSASL